MLAQNHIFSFTPKSLNPLEKSRDLEFDFWVPSRMRNHHSRSCDPDSPTLWKRENSSVSVAKDVDTSPLLPQDHHYSNLSPSSRTRRIEEGRREMMEMIRNLPESSYELSLKDIVDEQPSSQENQEEEKGKFEFPSAEAESNKNQKRRKRKKVTRTTSHQHHQVSRCNSMETGTFLIKMFFPSFLTSNKKAATSRNGRAKISPRTSFEGPDQRNPDMVSRIKMSPVAKDQGVAIKLELKVVPAGARAIPAGTMTGMLSWVAGLFPDRKGRCVGRERVFSNFLCLLRMKVESKIDFAFRT